MATPRDCVIVGGGPAGMVLALLLARQRVSVTLLEAHVDFDRAFRGDTVHPSTLEMLDDLGLADRLLARPHAKLRRMSIHVDGTETVLADFSGLDTRFPFIAMVPQVEFLNLLAEEIQADDTVDLRMACRATALRFDGGGAGRVTGVTYRDVTGEHDLPAGLTVAADGRSSQLRHLAGFEPRKMAAPMDVMWIVLPRRRDESGFPSTGFRIGRGRLVVVLSRPDQWQLGYVILKGNGRTVREAGIEALRSDIATLVPELADRVDAIRDWSDTHFLSVESSRLPRWYRDGFLAIGDAAHVMSPVGGVGINYAIQDAVAAANLLAGPLRSGPLTEADLAAVQARRELPTRLVQTFQRLVQSRLVSPALDDRPFHLPAVGRLAVRLPAFRRYAARFVGWGFRPERPVAAPADAAGPASG